jgi:hypothetical protein
LSFVEAGKNDNARPIGGQSMPRQDTIEAFPSQDPQNSPSLPDTF